MKAVVSTVEKTVPTLRRDSIANLKDIIDNYSVMFVGRISNLTRELERIFCTAVRKV